MIIPEVFKKKFLITGATGFIGACLTRRLVTEGADVHIVSRPQSDKWRIYDLLSHLSEHQLDLRDRDAVKRLLVTVRPQVIYHCAAYGVYSFQDDSQMMLESNVLGTANLVEAASQTDCECLVNSGTAVEYGPKSNAGMSETSLLEPTTIYGVSKAAATLFCQAIARVQQQAVTTVRLFYVYGPYEAPNRLTPYVIDCCLRNESPKLSGGWQTRDFVFIDDVVDLYLRIAAAPPLPGEIVNAASGTQHTIREFVSRAVELTGATVEPQWGAVSSGNFDNTDWPADASKAQRLFDWTANINITEGLKRYIEWLQQRCQTDKLSDQP